MAGDSPVKPTAGSVAVSELPSASTTRSALSPLGERIVHGPYEVRSKRRFAAR
jgi:hypothetical protein